MKLTDRNVKAARRPASGSRYLWDDEVPGFGLRVYASGRRSFVLRYGGRVRRRLMNIGEWGTLTVAQARKKALRERARVLDGVDPLKEREERQRSEAAEKASAVRFREIADLWMERHATPHRRSWKEDRRRLDSYILPKLGDLALRDVTRPVVVVLHAEIGKAAPVEANRARELVRAIWNRAEAWGLVPPDATNPAAFRKGEKFGEASRKRYVTPAELPALWKAIGEEPNVFVAAALRLYLFVGLRRRELLRARWSDIDFAAREWRIPKTKSGEPHVVPLPEPAAAILESLPRFDGNPHVFPGRKGGAHLVNIDKSWRRIRQAAGLEDVTVHDLRRSVGSWMASANVSLAVVGAVLGHAPGDVAATAVYARLQRDATRDALEKHARALLAVVDGGGDRKGPDALPDALEALRRVLSGEVDPEGPEALRSTLRALLSEAQADPEALVSGLRTLGGWGGGTVEA